MRLFSLLSSGSGRPGLRSGPYNPEIKTWLQSSVNDSSVAKPDLRAAMAAMSCGRVDRNHKVWKKNPRASAHSATARSAPPAPSASQSSSFPLPWLSRHTLLNGCPSLPSPVRLPDLASEFSMIGCTPRSLGPP